MPEDFPAMSFNFPRRWRGSSEDSNHCSSPTSPSSNPSIVSVQEARLREREDLGRYSPRSAVAGRLGELAIRGDCPTNNQIPSLSFGQTSALQFGQVTSSTGLSSDLYGLHDMPESNLPAASPSHHFPLDSQAPPRSNPDAPPQFQNHKSPSKSPKKLPSSSSPRKKRTASATLKMRNARRSPPLTDGVDVNPLTWSDAEITGHNPTDPTDDGYGINGIGFKPTAAIAWARSQKRQKQVAEWKHRESREARERRKERRDGHNDFDKIRTIQKGAIQKRVKFDV